MMDVLQGLNLIGVVLVLIALAIIWTLIRAVLRLTVRLFALGCLAIAGLVALAWLFQNFL